MRWPLKIAALLVVTAITCTACERSGTPDYPTPSLEAGQLGAAFAKVDITPVIGDTYDDANQNGVWDFVGDYAAPVSAEGFSDIGADGGFDGIWLAGKQTGRAAKGIYKPIFARISVFELDGERAAVVVLDTLGVSDALVSTIEDTINPTLGLGGIFAAGTGNHFGPDLTGLFTPQGATLPSAYLQQVVDDIAAAIDEAFAKLVPVSTCTLTVDTAGYNRLENEGVSGFWRDERDPANLETETTAVFFSHKGDPLGVWAFTQGSASLGPDEASRIYGDYPAAFADALELRGLGAATIFNGAYVGSGADGILYQAYDARGEPEFDGSIAAALPMASFERAWSVGNALAEPFAAGTDVCDSTDVDSAAPIYFEKIPVTVADANPELAERRNAAALALGLPLAEAGDVLTFVTKLELGPVRLAGLPAAIPPELWSGFQDDGDPASPLFLHIDQVHARPYLVEPLAPNYNVAVRPISNVGGWLGYAVPTIDFIAPGAVPLPGHFEESFAMSPTLEQALREALSQ